MRGSMMTTEEVKRERLERLARDFMRLDRVLTRDMIECEVVTNSPITAPAWNDGISISFNADIIGDVSSVDDIIALNGLNYHEVSHILFTPRATTPLRRHINEGGYFMAFNILEDQRIETLMVGMFKATEPYFIATFMNYCMSNEKAWTTNHLLAHGRRYLSPQIRDEFAKRFERPELVQKASDIIDEYRFLTLRPRGNKMNKMETRAFKLVKEFQNILQSISNNPGDPFGHMNRNQKVDVHGESDEEMQQEGAEWAEWYEQEGSEEEEGSGGGKGDESEGEDGESGAVEGDSSEGDGADGSGDADTGSEGDGEGTGSSSDSDGATEGPGGDGYSPGDGKAKKPGSDHSLKNAIRKAQQEAVQNEDVQRDAKNTQRNVVKGDGKATPHVDMSNYRVVQVTPETGNIARKFGRELERLRTDLDPGWHTHQSSGRLNVKRAMGGGDPETVFDVWDSGVQDAADIECVMAVDYSSSMRANMESACQAMWVIKRSIERVDGQVTVFGFADSSVLLYGPEEKAENAKYRGITAVGGTNPSKAIKEGFRILANSNKPHKMMLLVTDGAWYDRSDYIDRMRKHGVTTALAFIGASNTNYSINLHGCEFGMSVDSPTELVPFARRLVKSIMTKGK